MEREHTDRSCIIADEHLNAIVHRSNISFVPSERAMVEAGLLAVSMSRQAVRSSELVEFLCAEP